MSHPAVQVLPLLGLAHASDVGGEDHEEGRQHGVRLGPAGVLGEQAVHDGGALHDQPSHVLQTVTHTHTHTHTHRVSVSILLRDAITTMLLVTSISTVCNVIYFYTFAVRLHQKL